MGEAREQVQLVVDKYSKWCGDKNTNKANAWSTGIMLSILVGPYMIWLSTTTYFIWPSNNKQQSYNILWIKRKAPCHTPETSGGRIKYYSELWLLMPWCYSIRSFTVTMLTWYLLLHSRSLKCLLSIQTNLGSKHIYGKKRVSIMNTFSLPAPSVSVCLHTGC